MNPVQELSGATVRANTLTGLGVDESLTRTDAAGPRTLLTDALGSTLALTDTAGTVPTQYTYEPFGDTTASGAATTNAFQFTGRENDGTGLYYYRARYYHPRFQRFLSQDPIGLKGGPNLYSYVHGNPLRWVDPLGLDLTINEYECCSGFQHVGIGVNEGITQGFRPVTENTLIGPGEVGYDSDRNSFATRTITLRTSPRQDEAVRQFIEKIKRRPRLYVLAGRNCGWFVRSALKEAGIETLKVESPTDIFSDLEARNNADPGSFYRR